MVGLLTSAAVAQQQPMHVNPFHAKSFKQAFKDTTLKDGASFEHIPPADDGMPLGAGGAWGDYDGDGYPDLYIAQRTASNILYRNLQGQGFEDVTNSTGVAAPSRESTGALWGDYDNDGDQDLYVLNRGNNTVMRNDGSDGQGGWTFTNVTALTIPQAFGRTSAAAYGDYDNDGYLDLYVSNHSYPKVAPAPGDPDRADFLFHNIPGPGGERIFENVTAQLDTALLDISLAHSVAFFDYDNDNDLDIYVVNEIFDHTDPAVTGENLLWRNDGSDGQGGWIFTEDAATAGIDFISCPMGIAVGDYNSDGWLDFALSDYGANTLWMNNGGTFTEVGVAAGIDRPTVPDGNVQITWGVVFFDYNLDGWEDLYFGAGALSLLKTNQPNPLFTNNGDFPNNTFTEVSQQQSGAYIHKRTRTVIKADYDRDGDEDLYCVSIKQDARLLENRQQGGDFLAIKLVGTTSNRDAIGARVNVSSAGRPDQHRMVQSGSTTGGSNDTTLYFGCSGLGQVDSITIDWPSGTQSVVNNVTVNQFMTIVEP
jgi:hypothetical protein